MMIVIILFSIVASIKFIIFVLYNRSKMTKEAYEASFYNVLFQTLGFIIKPLENTDKMKLVFWGSFDMEIYALSFSAVLYYFYKFLASQRAKNADYGFIFHSMYLSQYGKLQHIYFLAIIMDSFFAQTFIQLFNLCCVMFILLLWAFTIPKSEQEVVSPEDKKRRHFRNSLINFSTSVIKILTNLQIFCLAFFSLQIIMSTFKLRSDPSEDYGQSTDSTFYKTFQSIGLLPNPEMRGY